MEPQQFSEFRHEAVHRLMRLNEECEQGFRISSWPHWDYDLERGTLTFSQDGVPKIVASIQVVGTTSASGGTWLWGWANEHLPPTVTTAMAKVRQFGEAERVAQLTEAKLTDDEHLGWAMTAIAAKLLTKECVHRVARLKARARPDLMLISSNRGAVGTAMRTRQQRINAHHGPLA